MHASQYRHIGLLVKTHIGATLINRPWSTLDYLHTCVCYKHQCANIVLLKIVQCQVEESMVKW